MIFIIDSQLSKAQVWLTAAHHVEASLQVCVDTDRRSEADRTKSNHDCNIKALFGVRNA